LLGWFLYRIADKIFPQHVKGTNRPSKDMEIKIMDEQQEDDKAKTARLEKKIEILEAAIECAKMDMENHKISFDLQNSVIDGLNHVIDEQKKEIEKTKPRTMVMH